MWMLLACVPDEKLPESEPIREDSETTVPDACPGDPAIEIGSGDREFVTIADNDQLPLIHGPQGGNHILGALRVWNMNPIVLIHYTITRIDNGYLFSDNTYRLEMVPEAECQYYYINIYGYIGFAGEGTGSQDIVLDVMWHNALMQMEVEDLEGNVLVDERVIVPVPEDPPE